MRDYEDLTLQVICSIHTKELSLWDDPPPLPTLLLLLSYFFGFSCIQSLSYVSDVFSCVLTCFFLGRDCQLSINVYLGYFISKDCSIKHQIDGFEMTQCNAFTDL